MKQKTELFFYNYTSDEGATFAPGDKWEKVAERVVRFLNAELGEGYPESFFYLRSRTKEGFKFYAGSVVDPSHWNDPRFETILKPEETPQEDPYKKSRNKWKK